MPSDVVNFDDESLPGEEIGEAIGEETYRSYALELVFLVIPYTPKGSLIPCNSCSRST